MRMIVTCPCVFESFEFFKLVKRRQRRSATHLMESPNSFTTIIRIPRKVFSSKVAHIHTREREMKKREKLIN